MHLLPSTTRLGQQHQGMPHAPMPHTPTTLQLAEQRAWLALPCALLKGSNTAGRAATLHHKRTVLHRKCKAY